jgi:hypothetical protein
MMKLTPVQAKALVLLVVFFLNTAVGFACSVGLDMGFNSHHHDEENKLTEETSHSHNHHSSCPGHAYAAGSHHDSKDPGEEKDDCCNQDVFKFNQLDKTCAQSLNSLFTTVFFTVFVSSFYNIDVLATCKTTASNKYFVLNYHPPILDIRIAIQSFQI